MGVLVAYAALGEYGNRPFVLDGSAGAMFHAEPTLDGSA